MTNPTTRQIPTTAIAMCALSGVLLAIQIGLYLQWLAAFDAAGNQSDRVTYFLTHLPFGLGRLGTAKLTLLSAAFGAAGLITAVVATRGLQGLPRHLSIGLAIANGLMLLWYGFTAM